LAAADSFYLEGGSKNLAQAEAGYRDFLQFFPNDPLDDDVMIKIAEIHMRQVMAPDRDITHAKQAELELKELIRLHPDSLRRKEADERLSEVQEYLAMHELKVAKFYYQVRQAPQATEQRTEYILKNYPNFSHMDEALYYHARSMADQEDTETAAGDLTRLLREFPKSDFSGKAKDFLAKWKRPVPDPDPVKVSAAAETKKQGMVPRFMGFVFGSHVQGLSQQGVIIDRTLKTEELVSRAQELSGLKPTLTPGSTATPSASVTTNKPDTRPRKTTQAGQDVEVKPGTQVNPASGAASTTSTSTNSKSDKDKKDKKKKKTPPPDSSSSSSNPPSSNN
ncbi:MAG TPA: outer membrane protein assembly factor BamD, partial [Blastocatellia bacterium]|nr:outer membrane protein assembly factor BamD [Blastocatellia bacterium]